ncbi:MAG: hypothetical protein J7L45_01335 [Candidatus Aenigmarchaeota archaeon]|nr:hypothetical protein [Candidatus Aenigmarchaeota archaeon]
MKPENVSFTIFVILGILMGFVSVLINSGKIAFLVAFFVMLIVGKILEKVYNEKPSWWLKNGGILYFLLWLVFWIFSYNLW